MWESLRAKWSFPLIFSTIILISFLTSIIKVPPGKLLSAYAILMRNVGLLLCLVLSYKIYQVHKTTEFKTISKYIFITFFFWIFSGFSWVLYYVFMGRIPTLSLSDLFFLLGYITLFYVFTSTLYMYKNYVTQSDIVKSFLIWIAILIPTALYLNYLEIYFHAGILKILTISLYPLFDSVVVFLLLVLLFMYRKTKIEFYLLTFAVGIFVSSVGDFFLLYYNAVGIYYLGSFPDNTFLFCLLFIAFGFSIILKSKIVYFTTSPLPEREEPLLSGYTLEKAKTYLFEEVEPRESIDVFYHLITHGVPGLALLRYNPEGMKQKLGLEKTPVLRFSGVDTDDSVSPGDLNKLVFIVSEFLRKTNESVILLEGIEYLVIQNDFLSVLKTLNTINDLIVLSNSRLILTFNPYTLTAKERALLERAFEAYRKTGN